MKHWVKNIHYRLFSGLYFPTFGLKTGIYTVNLRIQSECKKIWTRKTPEKVTFHTVEFLHFPEATFRECLRKKLT